jgi:hypothetical protein
MRRFLLPAAALALSACSAGYGTQRRALLTSLVGQPEAAAVQALGVPMRTYETGGIKFLAYDQRRIDAYGAGPFFGGFGAVGGYGGFGGFYDEYPPYVIERGCETTLEVSGGRVRAWSQRGTFCA